MKICTRCKIEKPLEDFPKDPNTKTGKHAYCRPCNSAKSRQYYASLTDEQKDETNHKHKLRKYGLTVEEYDQMLKQQNYCCAICKQPEPENKRLAVDHDHVTNKVRGLLCSHCNTGLGKFKDNIEFLNQAITYLKFAND